MIYFHAAQERCPQSEEPIIPYLPTLGRVHVDAEVKPQGWGEGQPQAVAGPHCQPQVPAHRHELQQICNHQARLILHREKVAGKELREGSGLKNCSFPFVFHKFCPDLPLKDASKASLCVPDPQRSFLCFLLRHVG